MILAGGLTSTSSCIFENICKCIARAGHDAPRSLFLSLSGGCHTVDQWVDEHAKDAESQKPYVKPSKHGTSI